MKTFTNEEKEFLIKIFRNEFMYQCKFFNKREIKEEDFNEEILIELKNSIEDILNNLLDVIPTYDRYVYKVDRYLIGNNQMSGYILDSNTIALKFFSKNILENISSYKETDVDSFELKNSLVIGIKIYLEYKDLVNIFPISNYEEYKYNLNEFIKNNVKVIYMDI